MTLQFINEIGHFEKLLLKGEKVQISNFILEHVKFFPNVEEFPDVLLKKVSDIPFKYVPRYELYFYNSFYPTLKLKTIVYAWKDNNQTVFNVNHYALGYYGFMKLTTSTTLFLNYLENILNNQTYFMKRPDTFQTSAFPIIPLLLEHKQQYLNTMYDLFKNSLLNMMFDGYEICGIKPQIEFETENDCPITGCTKPYPTFILNCGHKVSFMAYKGIINKTDADLTQSIKCPYCRKDMMISFQCNKIAYEIVYSQKQNENNYIENKIKENNQYISKDSFENL
jgi:glutaredoxin